MRTIGRPFECRSATSRSSSQPVRHAHARVDRVDADRREMPQADLDGGNRQVVQRAVLEAGFARARGCGAALHGGEVDRAAGKPRTLQLARARCCGPADSRRRSDSRTSCRTRSLTKSGCDLAQVEAVGRHERRRVEQHVPAALVRRVDQVERMLARRRSSTARERQTGCGAPASRCASSVVERGRDRDAARAS